MKQITNRHLPINATRIVFESACASLCSKNLCWASRFCTDGRGQQIQANVQGLMKQNASPGELSEAPRRRWKPGQDQRNQDQRARISAHAESTQAAFLD